MNTWVIRYIISEMVNVKKNIFLESKKYIISSMHGFVLDDIGT